MCVKSGLQTIWKTSPKTRPITRTHKVKWWPLFCASRYLSNLYGFHGIMGLFVCFFLLRCPRNSEGSGQSCQWHHETRGKCLHGNQFCFAHHARCSCPPVLFFSISQDNFQKLIQVQCRLIGNHEIVQPGRVRRVQVQNDDSKFNNHFKESSSWCRSDVARSPVWTVTSCRS